MSTPWPFLDSGGAREYALGLCGRDPGVPTPIPMEPTPVSGDRILSCDWGTSSFRLRLVETADGRTIAATRTGDGAAAIAGRTAAGPERADAFRDVLAAAVGDLARATGGSLDAAAILVSGMAGSSIGWSELPYAPLPVGVDGEAFLRETVARLPLPGGPARTPVILISGLSTGTDVLRGEETEIAGLLSHPDYAAFRERTTVVLPGTHSKHVRVRDGMIVGFDTYMTGELFSVLAAYSVLSHSVALPAGDAAEDGGTEHFLRGVKDARRTPPARALFRVRTRDILDRLPAAANRAYLTGLLVGAEAWALAEAVPHDEPVLLCAAGPAAVPYARACAAAGLGDRLVCVPPETAGQTAARGHAAIRRRTIRAEAP